MNVAPSTMPPRFGNLRKQELLEHVDTNLDDQERWRQFNDAYHQDDRKFMRFLVPPGKRVLELGCGTARMLAALERLATVDWGTATAPIYLAHERGVAVHVWVDETRPRSEPV